MLRSSTTFLYWSVRGEVCCSDHAPIKTDARWTIERWAPIPNLGRVNASRYQCQHCAGDGRAIVRRPRKQQG
jgi:hypothetical protein